MISTPLCFKLELLFQVIEVLLCVSHTMTETQDANATMLEFFFEQPFEMQRVEFPGDERAQCECQHQNYIDGGKYAVNGMFPYAVSIQFMDPSETTPNEYVKMGRCGGTLVTDRHVLTAAHCCHEFTFGDYAVFSISNVKLLDESRKISRISTNYVVHPEYDKDSLDNDICLIEFDPPVELGRTYFEEIDGGIYVRSAMITARNFAIKPHTWLTAIGWGIGGPMDFSPDRKILQYVEVPVVSYDECDKRVSRPVDRRKNFCAGGREHHDTCQGDSGNGIFLPSHYHADHILVGITSHLSNGYCGSGTPATYVNVTEYVDWIHENTLSASCSPCIMEIKDNHH